MIKTMLRGRLDNRAEEVKDPYFALNDFTTYDLIALVTLYIKVIMMEFGFKSSADCSLWSGQSKLPSFNT
jgi:hypothetical protein